MMRNTIKNNRLDKYLEKDFKEKRLLMHVKKGFKLDYFGQHGIVHWSNVLKNCYKLAKFYNISSSFFELFCLIHDSQRDDEEEDLSHGPNAAKFCQVLSEKGLLNLSPSLFSTLEFTCYHHSTIMPGQTENLLVKICIDADRLDLVRYGLKIREDLLFTDFAKSVARELNKNNY